MNNMSTSFVMPLTDLFNHPILFSGLTSDCRVILFLLVQVLTLKDLNFFSQLCARIEIKLTKKSQQLTASLLLRSCSIFLAKLRS